MSGFGTIGMVGLGNMGGVMGAHMIKAGFDVIGADPVEEKRRDFEKAGGKAVLSAAELAPQCRHIILSLPNMQAYEDVIAQLYEHCAEGTVVLETSTLPIDLKERTCEKLAEKGVTLLDAPLSGTKSQAEVKDLVIFGSGDESAWNSFMPAMEAFSKAPIFVGEFGSGMKMKFVANQLVAIHNISAAEAVLFGTKLGLDPNKVIEIVSQGGGSCRMLQIRGPVMVNRSWDHAQITNTIFHKDLVLIEEAMSKYGMPSPLFATTIPLYNAAIAAGHAEHDTSSVYAVLEQMSKPS